jgi:ligand-binding SRPBCC domain-containing protein
MVATTSRLNAAPETVWQRAVSPEGINYELRPLMRMTMPRRLRGMSIEDAPLGEKLGRSWVLLLGFIPFEFDDLTLAERGPGNRFLERSQMLAMKVWEHERTVTGSDGASEVSDRIGFEPRRGIAWIPGVTALLRTIVGLTFRHRHRRLVRYFGPAAG